jgi:integrase
LLDKDSEGQLDLDSLRQTPERRVSGWLRPFDTGATIAALIASGTTAEIGFLGKGRAAFFTEEEQTISLPVLWVTKAATNAVRENLMVHVSPQEEMRAKAPRQSYPTNIADLPFDRIDAQHGRKRFSELFDLYRKHMDWSEAQVKRMQTETRFFIELMEDPELRSIDLDLIHQFAGLLGRLPRNIYQHRRKSADSLSLLQQIEDADRNHLPRKQFQTVKRHVQKISQVLEFGHRKGWIHANSASGYKSQSGSRGKKVPRAQDERCLFDERELRTIFGQDWFLSGRGVVSNTGNTDFRPFHYWLPLLAVFSGGRRNELAQLYLSDICRSDAQSDLWYIDFNLIQPDKVDFNESDITSDKTLKTVNAIRVVPIHSTLVALGLIDYVEELKAAGYERLFPELKRDTTKGYGKPVGKWFNEAFLGQKLGFKRDGTKVFHSFRHNFITAAERTDISERTLAQLAGHSRGDSMSMSRYAKDKTAVELKPIIEKITFPFIAEVGRFDSAQGLLSINVALKRKQAMQRKKMSRTA